MRSFGMPDLVLAVCEECVSRRGVVLAAGKLRINDVVPERGSATFPCVAFVRARVRLLVCDVVTVVREAP
jgi:hypothetical protein